MITVLSPKEVLGRDDVNPELVVKVDELIYSRFDGVRARVYIDELPECKEDYWYGALQDLYRAAGWKVEVDKLGYGSKQREALVFSVAHLH